MALDEKLSMALPRLGWFHLVVWLIVATAAMLIAVDACRCYNQVAGTDKTPEHIAKIAFSMNFGPFVGPIANPGGTTQFADSIGYPALAVLTASVLPFLVIRRPVGVAARAFLNVLFLGVCLAWYFSAILSLGISLS